MIPTVAKTNKKPKVYKESSIMLLAIPNKLQLRIEAKEILCRITKVVKNQYTLICAVGPLAKTYYSRLLNKVLSLDESALLLSFLAKEPKITINKVCSYYVF